jgi:multiple sugar transport system permease protein
VPNAFSIYLFKGFFDALPLEVFEAGKIDGASDVRILANIVLPISKPVFGVITMFTFIGSWNDFFWPTLVLKSEDNWTFTIKIFNLINSGTSGGAVDYPTSLAMSLIAAIPTILVFAFFQKQLQKGMVWSGLK